MPLILLVVFYFQVQNLQRPLLVLMWQYSIVSIIIGMVLCLIQFAVPILGKEPTAPYTVSQAVGPVVEAGITSIVLACFANKISRYGFDKALGFIGIAIFRGSNISEASAGAIDLIVYYRLGHWVLLLTIIALAIIAVWTLKRLDTDKPLDYRVLVVLFGAAYLSLVGYNAITTGAPWDWHLVNGVFIGSIWAVLYAITALVVYLMKPNVEQIIHPASDKLIK